MIWIIERDGTTNKRSRFSGVMIVNARSRDDAEEFVKKELKRKGCEATRIRSSAQPLVLPVNRNRTMKLFESSEFYRGGVAK